MKYFASRKQIIGVALLLIALSAVWALAGVRATTRGDNGIDPETNMLLSPKLLFIHQDVVTDFPATGDGVRTGTFRGAISGTATTNFQFLPIPPPEFAADDLCLLVDPEGDQILFRVQVQGRFIVPVQGPSEDPRKDIVAFGGPYTGIYEVVEATGKYQSLVGRKFPCKGVGTTPAKNPAIGSVYAEVYSDQFDF